MSATQVRCVAFLVSGLLPLAFFGSPGPSCLGAGDAAPAEEAAPLPPGAVARLGTTRFRHFDSLPAGRCAAYSPKGDIVAVACAWTVRRWDVATGKELAPIFQGKDLVLSIAFFPDGRRMAVSTEARDGPGGVFIIDLKSGNRWRHFPVRSGLNFQRPIPLAVSPDGALLAAGDPDAGATVRVWKAETGELLHSFTKGEEVVHAVAFSSDGKTLAVGSGKAGIGIPRDKYYPIQLWDLSAGRHIGVLEGNKGGVGSLAFSPDGAMLLSCGAFHDVVRVWDPSKLAEVRSFKAGSRGIAMSPRGDLFATYTPDGPTRLWETSTAKCVREVGVAVHGTWSATFSPDGKRLLTSGDEQSLRLWDVDTGKEVSPLAENGHRHIVRALAFSPDGTL